METARYRHVDKVGKTTGSTLYRAWRDDADAPVLVKRLEPVRPADGAQARFQREYDTLSSLAVAGVIHPIALLDEPEGPAMVLEDFAGEPLDQVLARRRFDLRLCLQCASRLAQILAAVHRAQLIHNDFQPANLLFRADGDICLVDCSLASSSAVDALPSAGLSLAYLSPEQTGRMNRPVDHRTDFYSLGVLLYRMLTGRLPFDVDDPLEWVHCHIARLPPAAHEVAPEIPQAVSAIVQKLLAKVADERYQNALGLRFDLERCLAQWEAQGRIDAFALGERDFSEHFQIPRKLYARERETGMLQAAFDRMVESGEAALVLVSGHGGIGKSSLVYALMERVEQARGYFLSGKFDQFQQNVPYAAIADAFRKLAQRILGESDTRIAEWRQRFAAALGGNGQLILDTIPQFAPILGPQPPVAALPPLEAQYRFQRVFRQFLDVVIRPGHPLVLFLDDLQSADTASLALIRHLLTDPEPPAWLLVGAYRDNEVGPDHPLRQTIGAVSQICRPLEIRLAPLDARALCELITDTLHCDAASANPLIDIIERKTNGNPFFVSQFLRTLHQDGLIAFDRHRTRWHWDMARIRDVGATGNVVELMTEQLGRLMPATRNVLTLAALLGDRFTLDTLALVAHRSRDRLARQLQPAVQRGLLLAVQQDHAAAPSYCWLHDRVRQAAYSLLAARELPQLHLAIGRALLEATTGRELDEHLFDIVTHLNAGAELITGKEERRRLAELNLRAARKAKAAFAYAVAIDYLDAGIGLLDDQAWTRDYALACALHFELAECQFASGNSEAAIQMATPLMARARSRYEIASACQLKSASYLTKGELADAVASVLDGLARLGIALPAHPTPEDAAAALGRLQHLLRDRPVESLIDLPWVTDPEQTAPLLILATSYFTDPNLWVLHVTSMVAFCMEHGNAESALRWYGSYSLIPASLGEYEDATRFAMLAHDLMEQHGVMPFKTKASFYLAVANFWTHPLDRALAHAREGLASIRETGDTMMADYCSRFITPAVINQGTLGAACEEANRLLDFARRAGNPNAADSALLLRQFIDRLRDGTHGADPSAGNGETIDHVRLEDWVKSRPALMVSWCWICKLRGDFLFGDYEGALTAGDRALPVQRATTSFIFYRDFCLHYCLTLAALFDGGTARQRETWLSRLLTYQKPIRRWAALNPQTFGLADALVAAEIARITGQPREAMRQYEESIKCARRGRFIQDEALACELAARFYQAQGLTTMADLYWREACACYAQWGAEAKVRQLKALHPQLEQAPGTAAGSSIAQLDALSVIKASQAISGQIELDELLDTLMRTLLENAGAQQGYLLLAQESGLSLAAEARVDFQKVRVRLHQRHDVPASMLPESIVNYVRHSREKVLLADAAEPNPFSQDPYLVQQHPKSVLCLPILRQSELNGLLYLENNLATHAFTPNRLAVLELLASQAAISLANARLYNAVREREARIQRLIESNIIGIAFIGTEGRIFEVNENAARIVGYTRQELLSGNVNWIDLVAPEYHATIAQSIAEGRKAGGSTPYEVEYIRKDGNRVPALIGGALFEGSPDQGVAFMLDLTERKQAEAEREARKSAEVANAAKSAFLTNMSHELRTPLNTILGFTQLMQRQPHLAEDIREDLAIILRSGEHLRALINQVLDMAKIEAGRETLHEADFDLGGLLNELEDMFGFRAVHQGLVLRFLRDDLPHVVRADVLKLRQVLINLLNNALKFTRYGSVTLHAALLSTPAGPRLRFAVTDTGPGIAADELVHLFIPFTQARAGQESREGTGLGLAISRSFVRLMGGDIEIDSQPGKGTTIGFDIPVQLRQDDGAVRHAGPMRRVVALAPGQPGYRILVADDAADARLLLQRLLEPLGFEVRQAGNGQEAIELWASWQPHLIWMDMRMPVMDGAEAARRIKAGSQEWKTVIIALTASILEEDRADILTAGCDDFLLKPFHEGDLFALMQKHLGVRFLYEKEPAALPDTLPVEAGALAALPAALRTVLEQALIRLDEPALKNVCAQVRQHDAKLAAALATMAGEFQYDALLELIQNADGRMEHDGNHSSNIPVR